MLHRAEGHLNITVYAEGRTPWSKRFMEFLAKECLAKNVDVATWENMTKAELKESLEFLKQRPTPTAKFGMLAYVQGFPSRQGFFEEYYSKEESIKAVFGDHWIAGQIGQDDEDGDIYINADLRDVGSFGQVMELLRRIDPRAYIQEYKWYE